MQNGRTSSNTSSLDKIIFGSQDSPGTYTEDLKKNKEYFENLRRCYDLDDMLPTSSAKSVGTRDSLQSFKELLSSMGRVNHHRPKKSLLTRSQSSGNFNAFKLKRSFTHMDLKVKIVSAFTFFAFFLVLISQHILHL